MHNLAAFLHLKSPLPSNLGTLFSGLRITSTTLDVKYLLSDPFPWPDNFYSGLKSSNNAITWSLGSNLNLTSKTKLHLMSSSAFRSPNIDDLAKIRVQNDEVAVPNLDLTPEKLINYEVTLQQVFNTNIKLGVTGFYTAVTDAIVRRDYPLPDGTTFLIDQGDTLQTVANTNANSAKVYGVSINLQSKLSKALDLNVSYNFVRGRANDASEVESPLSHIPPAYGRVSLNYSYEKSTVQLLWAFNAEKPLAEYGGSADNLELATPDGSYGWSTLNLTSQFPVFKSISMSLGVENILDVHYRPFASGVSAPGRNLIVSVNGSF